MPCPLKDAACGRFAIDQTTYFQLDALADRHANTLISLGAKAGDRIAFLLPTSADAASLFFAAWRIGASICPLSSRLPPSQIEAALERLDAKIFIDSSFHVRATKFAPLTFPAVLLFTSGSTSLPKITVLSLDNLLKNAEPSLSVFGLRENSRWLLNLPLFHVAGIGILLRCVLAKATVSLDPNDPEITHLSAVPTQLYRATPVYQGLKCLLIGGAPIASYPERLPSYLTYGLTEMGSVVLARKNPSKIDGAFPLGFPLPNRELRLASDGEIEVRGECLFKGYWHEGTIQKPDDWFSTKDIGRLSEQGFSIIGRKDWQFISGGENIQPEEIENALLSLPGVQEAVVVPVDDPEFGKRPAALVRAVLSDAGSCKSRLLEILPKFKIPNRIFFVDELPKTGFKINRKEAAEIIHKLNV